MVGTTKLAACPDVRPISNNGQLVGAETHLLQRVGSSFELRRILTYKAENQGKTVLLVCPSYTSQRDSVTGKVEGERRGCRFYSKNGMIYDSDINAAINIGKM